jgi:hypothetical protein
MFRPIWPSSGVKNIWWGKLLLFHASFRLHVCCAWSVAPRYSQLSVSKRRKCLLIVNAWKVQRNATI